MSKLSAATTCNNNVTIPAATTTDVYTLKPLAERSKASRGFSPAFAVAGADERCVDALVILLEELVPLATTLTVRMRVGTGLDVLRPLDALQ